MSTDVTKQYEKVADITGYKPNEIAVIANQVCKGANAFELAYFLNVCKSLDLNPFNKEIWAYKDNRDNLIVFTGRDGMLSKAQKHPLYNGMRSSEVRKNDKIEIDIPNGKINHAFNPIDDRGDIVGAYCIVFRKGGEPLIEWSEMKVYDKGFSVWKTDPVAMIKKVAEVHALKKAFGFSGIQLESDFDINNGVASPADHVEKDWDRYNYAGELLRNSTYDDDIKTQLEIKIANCNSTELEEMIKNLKDCQAPSMNIGPGEAQQLTLESTENPKK